MMGALNSQEHQVDLVTVTARLREVDWLEGVGAEVIVDGRFTATPPHSKPLTEASRRHRKELADF